MTSPHSREGSGHERPRYHREAALGPPDDAPAVRRDAGPIAGPGRAQPRAHGFLLLG